MNFMSDYEIHQGDCIDVLRTLPASSVQTCVTSPPYFGLRDYQVDGQIGLEPTPAEYVSKMIEVFAEVWRVLRDDGTLWLNLGDSYANDGKWGGSTGGKHVAGLHGDSGVGRGRKTTGLKPKDLIGIPWRVAFALQDYGWYLRRDIIWHKPNCMTENVQDRPTTSHEYVFLLTKSPRYFYDSMAIAEPVTDSTIARLSQPSLEQQAGSTRANGGSKANGNMKAVGNMETRNKRSVWTVSTQPYREAHFATYPPKLIEPCILAGTSARGCCPSCGSPWMRVVKRESAWSARKLAGATAGNVGVADNYQSAVHGSRVDHDLGGTATTLGWQSSCECQAGDPVPCTVLDCFNGSGTTGAVAIEHGRNYVGIELNPDYIALAHDRISKVQPRLLLDVANETPNP